MDDADIIELYWKRDNEAIDETIKKYGHYIRKVANNILHNHEDVEECMNDTWIGAWNAMPPHRPNRLSTFLARIARNISYNRYKFLYAEKRGNGKMAISLDELHSCIPDSLSVEHEVEAEELRQIINKFLYSLPERQCDVFIRRYWFVDSISEIADRYAITTSYARIILSRTRKLLKKHLEKEGITL